MIKYGIPYMGGKNSIAEQIVDLLPKKENLYDLFCGGGAITHCAMIKNKYKNYYLNDIRPNQAKFDKDMFTGKFKIEMKWVSREEFFERINEPFIASVWSFGNGGEAYCYGKEVESYKKMLWNAIFEDEWQPLWDLGYDIKSDITSIMNPFDKKRALCRTIKKQNEFLKKTNHNLQSLERLESLVSLSTKNINLYDSCKSYEEVGIKPNSVIYCDIPYENTGKYKCNGKYIDFDYDKFFNWALNQTELVVISSYNIDNDNFICVKEMAKQSTLSATSNFKVIEKLYIPKKQLHLWEKKIDNTKYHQINLFEL